MSAVIIDTDGDLIIEVTEYDHKILRQPITLATQAFRVSRKTLTDSSDTFKSMLGGEWKEANQSTAKLLDWTISCVKIWFQVLHGLRPDYNIPIQATWHLVRFADVYRLDILKLKDWFATWYERQPIDAWYRQYRNESDKQPTPKWLLYPCFTFDHYNGFMRATKFCAYHYTHHIGEHNPTRFKNLYLPPRVIQQLNAAKGRLRTVLHRELYEPNDTLLKANCPCKEKTLWGYEKALTTCGAWPLERVAQYTAMHDILGSLSRFVYKLPLRACFRCRADYDKTVKAAKEKTERYFDGLCLDCMDRSKSDDEDADYWEHANPDEDSFVYACRAGKHTQSSWYFSYMGRKQRKDTLRRSQKMPRYDGDSE